MQSFMALMQMAIMPMFFLSGALFPVAGLPQLACDPQPPRPAHLRGRPDAPRDLRPPDISPAARHALDPGVTWWGWHVPTLLEAAVVALLGLVMLRDRDRRSSRARSRTRPLPGRAHACGAAAGASASRGSSPAAPERYAEQRVLRGRRPAARPPGACLARACRVAQRAPFDAAAAGARAAAIAAPTQRGDHTRAARRSMPRSIASMAFDSGAGLRRKPGVLGVHAVRPTAARSPRARGRCR